MSRRHILEDSDDDDGSPPVKNNFFTAEEEEAIEKCNIKINGNQGKYSEDHMARSIARRGEPPLEMVEQGGNSLQLHEKYRVKKGEEKKSFFEQDIYKVHGTSGEDYVVSSSEETILLDIEVIRRSGKAAINRMLKNKEMGGMVVFGPWWNYALQRILQLSSDESIKDGSLEDYTAVKIIRSLFAFIKDDLKEMIKDSKALRKLNSDFGIDWVENLKTARRVINHCGPSHFLDKELSAVEAHIEGLKNKDKKKPASATDAKPPAQNAAAAGTSSKQSQVSEEKAKKKKDDARKKRIQDMRASSLRRGAPSIIDSGVNNTASPKKAVASSPVKTRESFAQGTDTRSRNDAPKQGFAQKPPPEVAVNDNNYERKSPARPTPGGPSNANNSSSAPDDGWGRKRGEDSSARPFKTKGSWEFARRTLSCNTPVDSIQQEPVQPAQNDRPAPREMDSRGGDAAERAMAALNNISSHNDHSRGRDDRGQSRSREYERDRHDSSRSENYHSSRRNDSRGGHFDSRSSDRGRDGGRDDRDREDYSRSNSRSGGYSRDNNRGDDHRSRDSRSQDSDGEVRPQKRFRGPNETAAPVAPAGAGTGMSGNDNGSSINPGPGVAGMNANYPAASLNVSTAAGAGRGRGVHATKPAWLTRQEQDSAHIGPTGMPSSNSFSANSSMAVPTGGAGRGRGVHATKPAWMTRQDGASSNVPIGVGQQAPAPNVSQHAPAIDPSRPVGGLTSNNNFSGNPSIASRTGAAGAGRGRGADVNRPAWMTRQEGAPSNVPTGVGQQAHVPSVNQHAHAMNPSGPVGGLTSNGLGRGRGRGREKNLPAWMTNPTKP